MKLLDLPCIQYPGKVEETLSSFHWDGWGIRNKERTKVLEGLVGQGRKRFDSLQDPATG
jgi:hypothetical protein